MSDASKSKAASPSRLAAALVLAALAPAALATTAPLPQQSVMLLADRFTYESWSSSDFDTLAATLRATRPASVELFACGDAHHALLAAVPRLSDLPLQLQVMPMSAPACRTSSAVPLGERIGVAIDEAAVARYWAQVMP